MKYFFRALIFFLVTGFFLGACGKLATATPLPLPSPSNTLIPTFTFVPSQTPTATIEPTTARGYPTPVRPTLIPTIDPTLIPDLLRDAFSIQTIENVNGNTIRQITGWDYGFGGGYWYGSCPGYYWLDTNHILLYPSAGQVSGPEGFWGGINIVPQPIVINLESGNTWLPPVNTSRTCNRVYWSRELGILITSFTENDISTVFTYNFDGIKLSNYPGKIIDVSPSRTKILISEDTLVDLQTNKITKLNWSLEEYYEPILSELYWTSDETRVYRCCYFYADLSSGFSQRFQRSDFQDTDGNHLDATGLWFHQGEWVLNNKYFLVHWLAVDDGPVRYQPLFDPATKLFYDLWELAGISPGLTWRYNEVSPDGNYVWIVGFEGSYLVNLTTFEAQHYPHQAPYTYTEVDWSADSKFVWVEIYDPDTKSKEVKILSISDMNFHPLPAAPQSESEHWWHPTDNIVIYPAKDRNSLIILDASAMSFHELLFNNQGTIYKTGNLAWNPSGDKIAFVTEGSSLWLVDYPSLGNLKQVLSTIDKMIGLPWSPDGKSISFISDSKIYVVDVTK